MNEEISTTILALLNARDDNASICPSEVARALKPDDWRKHMPAIRATAVDLAEKGTIEIRQHGAAIDHTQEMKGPIRLARK